MLLGIKERKIRKKKGKRENTGGKGGWEEKEEGSSGKKVGKEDKCTFD